MTVRYLSGMPSFSVVVADNQVIILLDGPLGQAGATEGFYSFLRAASRLSLSAVSSIVEKESHASIAFENEVR